MRNRSFDGFPGLKVGSRDVVDSSKERRVFTESKGDEACRNPRRLRGKAEVTQGVFEERGRNTGGEDQE